MDEIRISKLECFAYHGVYPQETAKGQTFVVNLTMKTDITEASATDDLDRTVNYAEVCEFVVDWMENNTCKLIEAVAVRLGRALLIKYKSLSSVEVEICKPEAPIAHEFGNVSVKTKQSRTRVFLSVGSNMGNREAHIAAAVEALKADPYIQVTRQSTLITTEPYGGVPQDDFLNGAIEIKTLYTPEELLDKLHEIEASEGRERLVHWGPRTLDLDIVFFGKMVFETRELIIPHVDCQNREFVLKPLAEIAPHFRHPIYMKTVVEMLNELKSREE